MKTVGVLGASGVIGFNTCTQIQNICTILGGCRKYDDRFEKLNNFTWRETDIYSSQSLTNFCNSCDIILNCAGPACSLKDRIAQYAAKANAIYIDTSDIILINEALTKNLDKDKIYIAGAGYVPGLAGIILKMLHNEYFDNIDFVNCYQGGKQAFSPIAFTDIILSSISGVGHSDSYLKDGNIQKESVSHSEKKFIPGFQEEIYLKAYLSKEMINIADKLNIKELHWYNMVSDEKMMSLVMDSFQLLMTEERKTAIRKIQELCKEKKVDNIGTEDQWSNMLFDCYGSKNGEKKHIRALYKIKHEETACSEVAAEIVKYSINNEIKPGVYWANEILDIDDIKNIPSISDSNKFIIEELPYDK